MAEEQFNRGELWNTAMEAIKLRHFDLTIRCCNKLIAADPSREEGGWLLKALVQEASGLIQDSIDSYKRYLSLAPSNAEMKQMALTSLQKLGENSIGLSPDEYVIEFYNFFNRGQEVLGKLNEISDKVIRCDACLKYYVAGDNTSSTTKEIYKFSCPHCGKYFSIEYLYLGKNVLQIHQLSYFGELDENGVVKLDKTEPELGKGILTLKNPVQNWTDFFYLSFKYGFTLLGSQRKLLVLGVDFNTLERPDNNFYFLFNLENLSVKTWLAFVRKTQTVALVNGPTGSTVSCVNLHLRDTREQAKLTEALSLIR